MPRLLLPLLIFVALARAAPQSASPAQDGAGAGAEAARLLEEVAAAMKDAPAVAFEGTLAMQVGALTVTQKTKALLARPVRARLELAGSGQDALIVLDGAVATHSMKASRRWLQTRQLGTAKLEQYGVGPLAPLFFERGIESLRPYLARATVADDRIGDTACRVITWKVGAEQSSVWLAAGRLRRFRSTRTIDVNRFEQTFDYGPLDLAPPVADGAFTFTPPKGYRPADPADDSLLLPVGAAVPEFACARLDGTPFTAASAGGQPLLVNFWFYGCATCREELPRLQPLNAEFGARGVVMVAVDFGDAPETVADYFAKERFTLTPLCQQKNAVSAAFGVTSYPTTYLLTADGKVAWRAIGYDEASLRAALELVAPKK